MAKKRECTICKHSNLETPKGEDLENSFLYEEDGEPIKIHLCRRHSVQLFKLGQKSFLLAHYRILVDLIDSDEKKFINILDKTVRKFPDSLR
jgi:hypothetical protein